MLKRLITIMITLSVVVTTAVAASNVVITTPASRTQLDAQTPFDSNGTYLIAPGNSSFNYVYLQVYDVDLTTVIVAVNAVSTTNGNYTGTWKNPVDLQNVSQLHTPSKASVGLGQTKDFKLTADLYNTIGGKEASASDSLKARYPAGF